ncbi:sulfotransferase [Spirulina major]|uniref:sulfotransferase n=1 Tax=Spirulina major TaxID=270636 RepID=UPI0009346304|nr:sulfotransferase [Spirulina major]
MQNYALIVGHGRSGTNWLLDILDASPLTYCRNEPNEVHDSPCQKLAPLWQGGQDVATMTDMAAHWDEIAAWMGSRMGERDHRLATPKQYVHPWAQKLGVAYYPARPKIRQALRTAFPGMRAGEWPMPWWVGDQQKLEQAYAVLKINQAARVAVWLLKNRPQVPVLHIVRHPGGRLNSWLNRFLAVRDRDRINQRNKDRLRDVLAVSPEWSDRIGDKIDAMPIAESEMWFWRYVTETIHQAGEGLPHYHLILYENLAHDPIGTARQVYEMCDQPWTPDIEALIRAGTKESVWGAIQGTPMSVAQAWRKKLKPDEIESVNHVLDSSIMAHWWDE